MRFAILNRIISCYTHPVSRTPRAVLAMADSKTVENDREAISQQDGEKGFIESGHGDLTLGGRRERKLLMKLDLHLIPLIMLLYTFSFLDRYIIASDPKLTSAKPNQSQHWKCSVV